MRYTDDEELLRLLLRRDAGVLRPLLAAEALRQDRHDVPVAEGQQCTASLTVKCSAEVSACGLAHSLAAGDGWCHQACTVCGLVKTEKVYQPMLCGLIQC